MGACLPCGCICGGSGASARCRKNGSSCWASQSSRSALLRSKVPPFRPESVTPLDDKDGGFDVEVRAVGGQIWKLFGNGVRHTVGALKARLATLDSRFSTHRADLVLGPAVLGDDQTLGGCGVGRGAKLVCVFSDLRAAVLVIGGGVSGYRAVEDLSERMPDQQVILVDAQEYSENASGLLRAYADPATWENIVIRHEDAIARFSNARFVQGEVVSLRPGSASVIAFSDNIKLTIRFNYCIVATGCSWAPRGITGESLWRPSSLSAARQDSQWASHDERTVNGRRKHVMEMHKSLWALSDRKGSVLVVGADYLGVEWACNLKHFFRGLRVAVVDSVDRCLPSLPLGAASYADDRMRSQGIIPYYSEPYEPDKKGFWKKVGLQRAPDITFVMNGIAARNAFMPPSTGSLRGPGGGGWILTNTQLQVCQRDGADRPGQVWASGRIFAAGDCRYGAVVGTSTRKKLGSSDQRDSAEIPFQSFDIPPVPKTALAAIYWAEVACSNIGSLVQGRPLKEAGWPVIAGSIAVSLGPNDGVVAMKITWARDSGEVVLTGERAAELKRCLSWPDDAEFLGTPSLWVKTFLDALDANQRKAAVSARPELRPTEGFIRQESPF